MSNGCGGLDNKVWRRRNIVPEPVADWGESSLFGTDSSACRTPSGGRFNHTLKHTFNHAFNTGRFTYTLTRQRGLPGERPAESGVFRT